MARAIYREWFVKFRYPGHEDVPLVDSALGPIPEGWGTPGCDALHGEDPPRRPRTGGPAWSPRGSRSWCRPSGHHRRPDFPAGGLMTSRHPGYFATASTTTSSVLPKRERASLRVLDSSDLIPGTHFRRSQGPQDFPSCPHGARSLSRMSPPLRSSDVRTETGFGLRDRLRSWYGNRRLDARPGCGDGTVA